VVAHAEKYCDQANCNEVDFHDDGLLNSRKFVSLAHSHGAPAARNEIVHPGLRVEPQQQALDETQLRVVSRMPLNRRADLERNGLPTDRTGPVNDLDAQRQNPGYFPGVPCVTGR